MNLTHTTTVLNHIPTGLVSKNNIGARNMLLNILLCKVRAAARHINVATITFNVTMVTDPPTIPPNIPIL